MSPRRAASESLPFNFDGPAGLRVPEAIERLGALEAERARLLAKITKVKATLDGLVASVQATAEAVGASLAPLAHEIGRLERELHALFRELLAKGRLRPQPRREVKDLYELLHENGFLGQMEDAEAGEPAHEDDMPEWAASDLPYEHESGAPSEASDPSLAEALRAVFRRLARALHPDTVRDPAEQARRTAVMKEVTQAHRLGDLARLLELERNWLEASPAEAAESIDETERRCAALVETNTALRGQLRTLERELRALRKSAPVRAMKDVKGPGRGRRHDPLVDAVEEATADRDRYLAVRDLVRDFRDGKATLAELMAGPKSLAADLDELLDSDMGDLLEEMLASMAAAAPKARPAAKARRSKKR